MTGEHFVVPLRKPALNLEHRGLDTTFNYSSFLQGVGSYNCLRLFNSWFLSVSGTRGLSVNDFLSGLENSGWLRHIKAVLDAAVFLAKVTCMLLLYLMGS